MSTMIVPPPSSAHPKIIRLHDCWRRLAPAAGVLPGRRHLDPTEIPTLLENIWLLDVVGERRRFRFRLIGGAIQRKGIPGRLGQFIDQLFTPQDVDHALADLHAVVATAQPSWARGKPRLAHKTEIFELERILLPLAADGSAIDMLLCLSVFYRSDGSEF
jgi:hypothetical protein